jgi:CxxC motif-containing protein
MMRKILVILICILCVSSCKTTKNYYRVKSVKVKSHPRVKWIGTSDKIIKIKSITFRAQSKCYTCYV